MDELQNKRWQDIILNIPPQTMAGYIFGLKSLRQRHFKCVNCINADLYQTEKSYDCFRAPCLIKGWEFDALEVVINIIGTDECNGGWSVEDEDVKIVDDDGYIHSGKLLCYELDRGRERAEEHEKICKRTQADMVYEFSLLPNNKSISAVIVENGKQNIRFTIKDREEDTDIFSSEYYNKIQETKERELLDGQNTPSSYNESPSYLHSIRYNINQLKILIFQRLKTHLTSAEIIKVEDKIELNIYSLSLEFKSKKNIEESKELYDLFKEFQEEVENYREVLYQKKMSEEQYEVRLQKVSELLKIEPYQFEYLCSSLRQKLGYTKVNVTPQSNDKGIDIVGEKNGEKAVAQCKRYKYSVGSPDMQMFIGAMHNAGVTSGIYFTTGLFSREAEIMARTNGITLFDRTLFVKHLSLIDDLIGVHKIDTAAKQEFWKGDFDDCQDF